MEDIIYSSPETAPVDNLTVFKLIPEEGVRAQHYGTSYGACLSYNKGKWRWKKLKKHYIGRGSKTDHGGGGKYWIYNSHDPNFHNHYWHRILAAVFHPEHNPARNRVDHIDGNTHNNSTDNLRWCTDKENMRYAREIRTGERIITNLQKSLFYVTQ